METRKSKKKIKFGDQEREREMMMRALLLLCLGVVVNASNPQMPLSASFLGGDLEAERNSRKSHAAAWTVRIFQIIHIHSNLQ